MKNENQPTELEETYAVYRNSILKQHEQINKLFINVFLAGLFNLLFSFNIFHFTPLIIVTVSDKLFDVYYHRLIKLRVYKLYNERHTEQCEVKYYTDELRFIYYHCTFISIIFLSTSVFIALVFWIELLKLAGIDI